MSACSGCRAARGSALRIGQWMDAAVGAGRLE